MLRDLAELGVERGFILVAFEGAGQLGKALRLALFIFVADHDTPSEWITNT